MNKKHEEIFFNLLGNNKGQFIVSISNKITSNLTKDEFLSSKYIGLSNNNEIKILTGQEFINNFTKIWSDLIDEINNRDESIFSIRSIMLNMADIYLEENKYKLYVHSYGDIKKEILSIDL